MHLDIAHEIGQQVEIMIMDAKHNSESKVGKEIQKIKIKMESMNEKIKTITERLSRLEPGSGGGLLKADFQKSIAKLEEVWEGEVGTLKHELWQTIQAHNHNADLLKHHKEAIDQVQGRMKDSAPDPELEQVHAQLMQVDKVMQKELAKENQMDSLMQRISVIQQNLNAAIGHWPGAMPPPYQMHQGQAATAASAAAAAAQASKKAARKVTKSTKTTKASGALSQAMPFGSAEAAAASLRAEAPEFVPTTSGWTDA